MKVEIQFKQVLTFQKQVEMTKKEYEQLLEHQDDEISERNNPDEYHLATGFMTPNDINYGEHEITYFSIYKVGNKKK